jgi:hypothetical protein
MVAYKGMLPSGEVFDQGDIDFTLGAGQVITGWDKVPIRIFASAYQASGPHPDARLLFCRISLE